METMYYIGLDVHKKLIKYCVKDVSGRMHAEGKIPATRYDLDQWMKTLPQPWTVAMEATIFTAWIYDHLRPHAAAVKVAHPLMLRGLDGNSRTTAHLALSELVGSPGGTDEKQNCWAADGSRCELQQTEAPQGRILP